MAFFSSVEGADRLSHHPVFSALEARYARDRRADGLSPRGYCKTISSERLRRELLKSQIQASSFSDCIPRTCPRDAVSALRLSQTGLCCSFGHAEFPRELLVLCARLNSASAALSAMLNSRGSRQFSVLVSNSSATSFSSFRISRCCGQTRSQPPHPMQSLAFPWPFVRTVL